MPNQIELRGEAAPTPNDTPHAPETPDGTMAGGQVARIERRLRRARKRRDELNAVIEAAERAREAFKSGWRIEER